MKKIILAVILLAAAGGAVYLFSQQKNRKPPIVNSYKESIIGDWKIDSITTAKDSGSIGLLLLSLDSNLTNYTFRFADDGTIEQLLNDSITAGKARYEWKDSSQFVIIEGDSSNDRESMHIVTLTAEQLHLRSADSAIIYMKKRK